MNDLLSRFTPTCLLVLGISTIFCYPLMPTYTARPIDSEDYDWAIGQGIAIGTVTIASWIILAGAVFAARMRVKKLKSWYSASIFGLSCLSFSVTSLLLLCVAGLWMFG